VRGCEANTCEAEQNRETGNETNSTANGVSAKPKAKDMLFHVTGTMSVKPSADKTKICDEGRIFGFKKSILVAADVRRLGSKPDERKEGKGKK
jgi:hypothetical protein